MKQLVLDLIPAPAPTLANFVAGRNREALAVLQGIWRKSGQADAAKVIYLWGIAGCGKTHLMRACVGQGLSDFSAAGSKIDEESTGSYTVDDVDRLSDVSQQTLFNLVNRMQMTTGVVIATGNAAPRDLAIRRDLASRLGSGLVFQLQPLTDDERSEALRVHARTRGFALREEVIAYLLRHARRDMSSLMSILDELDAYSIETGREITLPLLKEVAQPSLV